MAHRAYRCTNLGELAAGARGCRPSCRAHGWGVACGGRRTCAPGGAAHRQDKQAHVQAAARRARRHEMMCMPGTAGSQGCFDRQGASAAGGSWKDWDSTCCPGGKRLARRNLDACRLAVSGDALWFAATPGQGSERFRTGCDGGCVIQACSVHVCRVRGHASMREATRWGNKKQAHEGVVVPDPAGGTKHPCP